jgi:hypothetical protein
LVYLVLGAAGSGRREVLADLIEGGMGEGAKAAVLLSATEWPDAWDAKLPDVTTWRMIPDIPEIQVEAEFPEGVTHVFIVFDGRMSPVDQIEGFKGWLAEKGQEVARLLCVVNCKLLETNPKLFAWYEACIYFSDVILLNQRENVPNKWMGDFKAKFEDKFYPCLFEFVRDGRVKNPPLVLAPVARRMSHVFDETDWVNMNDEDDEEEDMEDGDEVEVTPEVDIYLERRNGGRRVHELPHIADFLPKLDA